MVDCALVKIPDWMAYVPDGVLRLHREQEAAGEAVDVLDAGDEGDVGVRIGQPRVEVPVGVDDQPPDEGEAQPG